MTPVALSKFKISRLLARLNSQVEAEAKQAASELDGLFYPITALDPARLPPRRPSR